MNYIWCIMICASFICALINGRVEETMAAAFSGAQDSVTTLLSFAGLMCFWNGLLNIAEKSGICSVLEKLFLPIINVLFKNENKAAKKYITMNITANLLGMGNAATPMGINAMTELQKNNPKKERPSKAMCTFMVLNTTSFTLIPSTVLSLRAAALSASPESVIIPIWIVSGISIAAALISVKLFVKNDL